LDVEKRRERERKYRSVHRKEINERRRRQYARDRERIAEHVRQYHLSHPEKRPAAWSRYKNKNVERLRDHWFKKYRENPNKFREKEFKRKYNLTLEDIDERLIRQNHQCLLCGKSLVETKRCIDHNHETGKVRGILCTRCNTGLGYFRDDPVFLSQAIAYLSRE
jgi:hypothetical protein